MRALEVVLLLACTSCDTQPLTLGPAKLHATTSSSDPVRLADASPPSAPEAGAVDAAPPRCGARSRIDAGEPVPLPFIVDRYFFPTGGAGDAAHRGAVIGEACDRPRPPSASGQCYHFEYTPRAPSALGTASYAALFFQYPAGNWGSEPGRAIAPGARRVVFYAAGVAGGEIVTFRAGGIRDSSLPCSDDFSRELTVRLTTGFERYEIGLSGLDYGDVISPFSWTISQVLFSGDEGHVAPIGFYLDGVRWE